MFINLTPHRQNTNESKCQMYDNNYSIAYLNLNVQFRNFRYTLKNNKGTVIKILNYGGIITNILVPDNNGKVDDICLGFDDMKGNSNTCIIYYSLNKISVWTKSFKDIPVISQTANEFCKGRPNLFCMQCLEFETIAMSFVFYRICNKRSVFRGFDRALCQQDSQWQIYH